MYSFYDDMFDSNNIAYESIISGMHNVTGNSIHNKINANRMTDNPGAATVADARKFYNLKEWANDKDSIRELYSLFESKKAKSYNPVCVGVNVRDITSYAINEITTATTEYMKIYGDVSVYGLNPTWIANMQITLLGKSAKLDFTPRVQQRMKSCILTIVKNIYKNDPSLFAFNDVDTDKLYSVIIGGIAQAIYVPKIGEAMDKFIAVREKFTGEFNKVSSDQQMLVDNALYYKLLNDLIVNINRSIMKFYDLTPVKEYLVSEFKSFKTKYEAAPDYMK